MRTLRTAGRARFTCACGVSGKQALTLPIAKSDVVPLYRRKKVFFAGEVQAMSETSNATPPRPDETPDRQAIAQVEKWMAIIREISHERAPTIIPSDDPAAKA
jgi:hypothetical protein